MAASTARPRPDLAVAGITPRLLATAAVGGLLGGLATAAVAGGALLYVIMMYGFAPLWNTEIVDFTPRVPFFLSHLLFGAVVGGWVYWQAMHAGARLSAVAAYTPAADKA